MNKKDILELKKRFKKESCTFTKVCGCYVDSEKNTVLKFRETFLNLPDEELFKYLEIAKKSLSGKIGNNLLELTFPLNENLENEKQQLLMMLSRSGLKEDALLSIFYESIIENFDYSGNYLILLFHDVYDVMVKTSDNRKLDESEEMYEYILCAICPVSLSKAGLGYFDRENAIKARLRDWVVEVPTAGFTFPGFIDRGSDVDTLMYYTKNAKIPHSELMADGLGCLPKQTASNQLESFESLVKSTIDSDEDESDEVFINIQESLNTMVEEHKEIYEDVDEKPITISGNLIKDILIDNGVSEETSLKIESAYEQKFGQDLPPAENLIDTKLIKKNAQKKKEEQLLNQIEVLESKLERVESVTQVDLQEHTVTTDEEDDTIHETSEVIESQEDLSDPLTSTKYDVVLQVKPEKLHTIKTELINGQRCIVVPIDDDEQATINGIDDLL